MKLHLLLFAILSAPAVAQSQTFKWAEHSESGTGSTSVYGSTIDQDQNMYTFGVFSVDVDLDPSTGQSIHLESEGPAFLAKYDSTGQLVWSVNWGQDNAKIRSVEIDDSGNVFVLGHDDLNFDADPGPGITEYYTSQNSRTYISKFNSQGDFLWVKGFETVISNQFNDGWNLAIDNDNNVIIVGDFEGTLDLDPSPTSTSAHTSAGSRNAFITKWTNDGDFLWGYRIGGVNYTTFRKVAIDLHNNIVVGGSFIGTVFFDPSLTTGTDLTAASDTDGLIAKYDENGDYVWAKQVTGSGFQSVNQCTIDDAGNVIVTGTFENSTDTDLDPGQGAQLVSSVGANDAFLIKLFDHGGFQWARSWGSMSGITYSDIDTDPAGHIYLSSWYITPHDMDPGAGTLMPSNQVMTYFLKMSYAGSLMNFTEWGDNINPQSAKGMSVADDGSIYISGYHQGNADFDPGAGTYTMDSGFGRDLYLLKLGQSNFTALTEKTKSDSPLLYPNPSSGVFSIKNRSDRKIQIVDFYTMDMKKVQSILTKSKGPTHQVQVDAESGIYLVRFEFEDGSSETTKVVVK